MIISDGRHGIRETEQNLVEPDQSQQSFYEERHSHFMYRKSIDEARTDITESIDVFRAGFPDFGTFGVMKTNCHKWAQQKDTELTQVLRMP